MGSSGATGSGFAQCIGNPPNSTCDQPGTCLEAACGTLTSELDTNGCVRKACTSDGVCGADELCFPASVVIQTDALTPRFGVKCQPSGDRCQCTGTDVRTGAGAYCVAKTTVLGDWGCLLLPSVTGNCSAFAAWISAANTELGKLTLYSTVQTRAATCVQMARDKYATVCP